MDAFHLLRTSVAIHILAKRRSSIGTDRRVVSELVGSVHSNRPLLSRTVSRRAFDAFVIDVSYA